jgi:hypothetical protein
MKDHGQALMGPYPKRKFYSQRIIQPCDSTHKIILNKESGKNLEEKSMAQSHPLPLALSEG